MSGTEYKKILQRQNTRSLLQQYIREQFLAFDLDSNHLIYSKDGISYLDFYNSGEIDSKLANLDASHLTTGTIDPARLPVLLADKAIISSGGLSALTPAQQAQIATGTTVCTTDGFRWIYSGSGDKTSAASYTQLADITPSWSVIDSKPTTLAGYSILASDPLFDGKYLGIGANAVSASKLQTARLIAGVSFDGTANISIPYANLTSIPSTFTPSAHIHAIADTTGLQAALDAKLSISTATATYQPLGAYLTLSSVLSGYVVGANSAIAATDSVLGAFQKLQGQINNKQASGSYSLTTHNHDAAYLGISANAVSSTKLATARAIAGVAFDGTAAIAIPYANLTGLPTLGTLAAKSTVTWTSDISGVPSQVAILSNATTHGSLKLGNSAVGSWHAIEGSDANLTRVMFNDTTGNNIMGFYGLNAAKSASLWYVSWDRSGNMVDGWVPWSRLTSVPSTFTPSAHTHLWAHITDKPTTFTPSAHNQAWSTITGTPTTLAGYGISDAATSGHNHNTTYQLLENQRVSTTSNVRFGSVTSTAAVNVEGQLGVTGYAGFSNNMSVTGYINSARFITTGGTNQTLVLGDGTLRALSDFASSSSLGSFALSSHTHTKIEVSNENEIVIGNGFNDVTGKLYVNWRGAGTTRISDYMFCDGKLAGVFSYITAAGFKLNGGAGNNLLSDNGSAVAISSFALAGHNHNSTYAPLVHNHDSAYFKLNPASTQTVTGASTIFTSPIEARGASLFVGDVALSDASYANAALEVSRSTNNNTYHAGIGFHNAGNNGAYLYYSNSTGKFRFRRNNPDDLGLWDSSDFSSANIGNWNDAYTCAVQRGRIGLDAYTGEDNLTWASRNSRGNHFGRIHGVSSSPSYFNFIHIKETSSPSPFGVFGFSADGQWYVGKGTSGGEVGAYHTVWTSNNFSQTAINSWNSISTGNGVPWQINTAYRWFGASGYNIANWSQNSGIGTNGIETWIGGTTNVKMWVGGVTNVMVAASTNVSFGVPVYSNEFHSTGAYVGTGLFSGNGDGASLTTYNQKLTSWYGTAIYDACNNAVRGFIDHRTGSMNLSGSITAANIYGKISPTFNNVAVIQGVYLNRNCAGTVVSIIGGTVHLQRWIAVEDNFFCFLSMIGGTLINESEADMFFRGTWYRNGTIVASDLNGCFPVYFRAGQFTIG